VKKKKVNSNKLLSEWKQFLTDFDEKGFHTTAFPEDVVRASSDDKIVFYSPQSNIVFGTIFKAIPLVIILLIHPKQPAVDLIHFANEKARSFLGTDDSFAYPENVAFVNPEEVSAKVEEVLLMAFPQDIVEKLMSEKE
jgi:hypothetical protein